MAGFAKRPRNLRDDAHDSDERPHRAIRLVEALEGVPEPAPSRKSGATARGGQRQSAVQPQPLTVAASPRRKQDRGAQKPHPTSPAHPNSVRPDPVADALPGVCAILSVHPEGEGETVAVVLTLPAHLDEVTSGGSGEFADLSPTATERVKLHLLVEQYAELGVRPGEITPQQAEELLEAGRLCAAVRRGMTLLQYGDQSAKRLAFKLTAKGVDRHTAEDAAAYLAAKGYIREDDTARRRAEQGVRKLWGPRRIREDLRAQGFSTEAIDDAMDALEEVDFEENCAAVIRRKYRGVPEDRAARQKLMAAMLRLGYGTDTIRHAMRTVLREDEGE